MRRACARSGGQAPLPGSGKELGLDLQPTAIGKDYLGPSTFIAPAPHRQRLAGLVVGPGRRDRGA